MTQIISVAAPGCYLAWRCPESSESPPFVATHERIIRSQSRRRRAARRRATRPWAPLVKTLELRDVAVRFGQLAALDGLDLALAGGRVTLLAGPNGAGKSTLIRVLLGLVSPDRGSIVLDGHAMSVGQTFKARLGYLPESIGFSETLTGREVLGFFAQARGVLRERTKETLSRVGLASAADRPVRDYSRGMRQRLGLGVSILANPELLVLDEPSGGLDQDGLSLLWSVLEEWRSAGRIVLLASHEIALLETRVDDVCLLAAGRKVAQGTPAVLRRRAELALRVDVTLDPDAHPSETDAFLSSVRESRPDEDLALHGAELSVRVRQAELLPLLDLAARQKGAVRDVRVKEPPFDEVYRRLLESAP
jgi:Cu-processing system ATP-binding protein